ncbi:MAG: hypothetical protein J3K34DRAFT_409436 [Monoraphidium minutum]|nr:MAG: hypothetical protein J3K34DRAFT_409436 [Monoraphidium minutum]
MQEASKLLLEVGDDAGAVERVEAATRQLHEDMRGYMWTRLSTAARHAGSHITDGRLGAGDDAFWAAALSRVVLTVEQEDALAAAFELGMADLGALHARQRGVAARLRELLQEGFQGVTLSTEDARRVEMVGLLEELEAGLEAEYVAWLMIYKAIQHVLPPLAVAQMLVACFPYWPDGSNFMMGLWKRIQASRAERAAAASGSSGAPPKAAAKAR